MTPQNSAERLVASLAFDLASKLPSFGEHLDAEMKFDEEKKSKAGGSVLSSPAIAFKQLVLAGLEKLPDPSTVVVGGNKILVLIDVLDECVQQGDEIRRSFLEILCYECSKFPRWARIFTTGRPEADIYESLRAKCTESGSGAATDVCTGFGQRGKPREDEMKSSEEFGVEYKSMCRYNSSSGGNKHLHKNILEKCFLPDASKDKSQFKDTLYVRPRLFVAWFCINLTS
ncbi:hypothetical protein BJ742DRAFT_742637 [Cladochytrium replicatum]|nr:hypothetical protein BJ742DRAFT_742637 [Cladochytrium replicatum]